MKHSTSNKTSSSLRYCCIAIPIFFVSALFTMPVSLSKNSPHHGALIKFSFSPIEIEKVEETLIMNACLKPVANRLEGLCLVIDNCPWCSTSSNKIPSVWISILLSILSWRISNAMFSLLRRWVLLCTLSFFHHGPCKLVIGFQLFETVYPIHCKTLASSLCWWFQWSFEIPLT